MTDMDKMALRAQLQQANQALMAARATASAPVITPNGPIVVQAPMMICVVLEMLSKVLDQMIDKA